jgi:nifR3 family TIM-barrel protein
MAKLLEQLRLNPFVLAPMAGITDSAFRSFMKEMGAGIVVSELVSATGIKYDSKRTFELLDFAEDQRPVGLQLFGESPEDMAFAAQIVEQRGADFVDLNFGCPVPKVVKKGGGAAILKDLLALRDMLRAVVGAVKIPVTIKIRTGWDESTRNAEEVLQVAYDEGVYWVSIHGRTRAQGYEGQADWEYMAKVKQGAKLPVLGNGDILTADQACARLLMGPFDGVLIGRGALKNPYIFQESLKLWKSRAAKPQLDSSPLSPAGTRSEATPFAGKTEEGLPLAKDFTALFQRLQFFLELSCEPRIVEIQLKKFASWFSTGYPGSSQFRKKLFQAEGYATLNSIIYEYFSSLAYTPPEDTSSERFLMGGHG